MADENENNENNAPEGAEVVEEFATSAPSTPEEAPEAEEANDEGFVRKKKRAPRAKRVVVPKDSASFFRARAKQFRMFNFTEDGNLQVPDLAGQAAKVIELPRYRESTEAELEEGVAARRQELENVEREYDEMLRAYKDAMSIWKDTGVASDVIAAQRELARLDALRSQLRSPLRWTKEFKGLSIRQLMPDLFYEVRKVGYKCYGMRLRSNPWDEMTKIGEMPTPAVEEGEGSEEEEEDEEEAETFVFFSAPDDPEHGALSPDTMVEFVVNSTKYTSIIQAYEVERITQLGRRKDLGGLFLRAKTPVQVRALAARVTGDVENPRELWISILKALVAQHPRYAELLRSTGKDTLVYANPKDTRWGIGLSADDPGATERSQWKGENLLGQAWQAVRVQLPAETEGEEANVQEGGSGETKYTEHAFTKDEGLQMRKNILKGYYRKKVHF